MKLYFQSNTLIMPMTLVLILGIGVSYVHAQYLKAFVGFGKPDIADGAFDGTITDIEASSGEWDNFILLDFESDDPNLTVDNFTIDFGPSENATIDFVYTWGHNPDGAVFQGATLNNDVYTASFMDLDDDVDVLYIHIDFDQRSTGMGTPLGKDYVGATITATLSDGTVLSGIFDVVDALNAFAQIGIPGVPVDLWIKDCEADIGTVPSNAVCPEWWTSPDVFIDNDYDGRIDAPIYGVDNILRAIVRNQGSGFAENVSVSFYYRNSSTGLVFPDGANLIGTSNVNVPPDGVALTSVTWHELEEAPAEGHWCIGVVLDHADDPRITPTVSPPHDNNVGCANIWFIAGRAGDRMNISFSAGSAGKSGFGLEPWPRQFILEVTDELPLGWTWKLEGAEPESLMTLELGEDIKVTLYVVPAANATPHSGGSIKVRQIDVHTGTVVGGVQYNIYEDHHSPEPVDKVVACVRGKVVILTWEPVQTEKETGLKERLAYYEIFRNGRSFRKIVRDEDPFAYGMQWTDVEPSDSKLSYAIRAVDEGGNTSEMSPQVTVTIPGAVVLFNWLCWVLLIIIVILLFLLLRRRISRQP